MSTVTWDDDQYNVSSWDDGGQHPWTGSIGENWDIIAEVPAHQVDQKPDPEPLTTAAFDNLRVEGDVVVLLSEEEQDKLLLHSSLLRDAQHFEARLSGRWCGGLAECAQKEVWNPETGANVVIWQYSLKWLAEDEVYVLEPGELRLQDIPDAESWSDHVPFYLGRYSVDFASMKHSYMDNRDVLNQPIQAHKLLFGLMYGTRVDLSNYELRSVFECIANATAYAQYYGLMDLVRVPLRQRYEALKGLFKHIAEEPLFHALLARHLKSVLGFQEAARHLVGGFAMYEQAPLDSAAYKDLKILVYEKRHVLHDEVTSLMSRIRRELLSSRPVKSNSGKTVVGSTPTKFLDGRNKKRGWRECCRFLAQSMVSQWILDELEKTTYNECQAASKSNGYPSEMLTMMANRRIFSRILAADKANDTSMFGRHDRMTEKFPLGGNQSGETGKQLRSILKAAAQAIRESPCSARRLQARCMPYVPNKMRELPEPFLDYFTHITADESELPWNVQEQFEEATAPVGEYFRASKAWVNAVGLGRPHDDEGVED